jgi:hypothetical protein
MSPQRILAQATMCDQPPGAFEGSGEPPFVVRVIGRLEESGDELEARIYEIAAEDEREAAFTALNLYVVEMTKLN